MSQTYLKFMSTGTAVGRFMYCAEENSYHFKNEIDVLPNWAQL